MGKPEILLVKIKWWAPFCLGSFRKIYGLCFEAMQLFHLFQLDIPLQCSTLTFLDTRQWASTCHKCSRKNSSMLDLGRPALMAFTQARTCLSDMEMRTSALDFTSASIHQLSETAFPFAYLSITMSNLCMPFLNSTSPLHHSGIM